MNFYANLLFYYLCCKVYFKINMTMKKDNEGDVNCDRLLVFLTKLL